ncbi:cfem domain-containing protein [Colletotrichum incanum]|uniref:Cfem domain-containing protein n=1 Tax=Colletotrichum incanum TaxID=1573173 RepID=A0A161Y2K7_COLIC|nr:cfem domain-containing protein [Colletotrichum incanum]
MAFQIVRSESKVPIWMKLVTDEESWNRSPAYCKISITRFVPPPTSHVYAMTQFLRHMCRLASCPTAQSRDASGFDRYFSHFRPFQLLPVSGLYLAVDRAGEGRDIWTLNPDQITDFLVLFYALGLGYISCLPFVKASILFMHLRIFPDEKFRIILWCTQVFNCLLLLESFAGTICSCHPLNFFWSGWAGEMKGKCIKVNAFILFYGVVSVVLDLWMLILPATQLYSLHMKLRKKIGVMLMFSVGIFSECISHQNTAALCNILKNHRSLWSRIELCVGIFVAYLPSTRQVWRRFFPTLLEAMRALRPGQSAITSNNRSQELTGSGPSGRPYVVSYKESSIAHLVGGFKKVSLTNLSPIESGLETTEKK